MVTFIIYAVGLRILWQMAKWNLNALRKASEEYSNLAAGILFCLSVIGWVELALFIARN